MAIVVGIVLLVSFDDKASVFVSQNPVNKVHAGIDRCQICHEPIKEVRPNNCAARGCHTIDYFRERIKKTDSPLSQHIRRRDCVDCHTEHNGKDGTITKPFNHKNQRKNRHKFTIDKAMTNSTASNDDECQTCHLLPDVHKEIAEDDCGKCHSIESFKAVDKT